LRKEKEEVKFWAGNLRTCTDLRLEGQKEKLPKNKGGINGFVKLKHNNECEGESHETLGGDLRKETLSQLIFLPH